MSSRLPIPKRIRFAVFKRDGFTCQYCGAHPPDVILEIDHIEPISEGGSNDESNLATACTSCNRGKAGIPLTVVPKPLSERAAEIEEMEEQLAGYRDVMRAHLIRVEQDMWEVAEALSPGCGKDGFRRDWLQSIKRFNEHLELHEVVDAAERALARKPYSSFQAFKYFCGICWTKIRGPRTDEDEP
jgi:HNH endonuclease